MHQSYYPLANNQTTHKNNFKKFLVDLFYNKIVIGLEIQGNALKQELSKLLNLSKNEITALNIKLKENSNQKITYEMMYFYIEELF